MLHNEQQPLAVHDPEIAAVIEAETKRQEEHIELIASENYTSRYVMEAQGSQLTNKYAEGYPGKRYYGGCEFVDQAETLAIERVKQLFAADFANVQPHSGSQANAAAFMALLQPSDTILGMSLDQGGHLTHGSPVNFSGKLYQVVAYGLDASGQIDYEAMAQLAQKHQPKLIIGGFSAYSGLVDWQRMREIADTIGAYLLADIAHVAGLIASGVYPSPMDHAHVVTSTTHKTLAGPRGGIILSNAKDADLYKKLNSAVFPGGQGGPLMHVIAAKAIAFKQAMSPEFKTYQKQVVANAQTMASVFQERGYTIVSGGTQNHLLLLNLVDKGLTGKAADAALSKANITVNKNAVPNDPQSPFVTSGIRIGTPAITRRGMKQIQAQQLTHWICDILDDLDDAQCIAKVRENVLRLCQDFPVYS